MKVAEVCDSVLMGIFIHFFEFLID